MFNWVMGIASAIAIFLFWKAGHGHDAEQAAGFAVFIAAYPVALLLNAIFGKN
jgi:hypothetical protein